jgi:two-component system, OmpR family, KDP operon response regulator KdpE
VNTPVILVVDDEPQIRRVMRVALTNNGYEIIDARTGEEAVEAVSKYRPTLVLLDINMPGMGGIETCRELRRHYYDVPILMLTVRSSDRDKVEALDAGADDYITKPFSVDELFARIRVALRRISANGTLPSFSTNDLEVDFESRQVRVRGRSVHLTPKEFELLKYLAARAGKPVAHRVLLKALWGPEYGEGCENLRVLINNLRRKIEPDPANPKYVLTDAWFGYCFQYPREKAAGKRLPAARRVTRDGEDQWSARKGHA